MSKVTCNAREKFDGKPDRGEEQTNQSFPSHSVVRLSDLQTNFAGNARSQMDVTPQALSGLDWIGWVSQGDTEHLTVANKLEMRMYKKERHMP